MKRVYITTVVTALLALAVFSVVYSVWDRVPESKVVRVGFIYDSDASAPYTYNFALAQSALERELGERAVVYTRSNVAESDTAGPTEELVRVGCDVIFTNNYSDQFVEVARNHPNVQFCQTSFYSGSHENLPDNYHTFNGKIHEARYVTGVAAGLRLREWIDGGELDADEALVGYVGAFPSVEVVSGYTAFLLGVRSVVPEATMRVRYTQAWSNYNREKSCVRALIDEGCAVICQHTDTVGPAMACEEAAAVGQRVIHVGYNESMTDIAPGTSLTSARVNWVPYVVAATRAVMAHEDIEGRLDAEIRGNDARAGFDQDWVQVLDINRCVAAEGTAQKLQGVIDALKRGTLQVFKGDYTGTSIFDLTERIYLAQGYREAHITSWPTFHYLLDGVIVIEE